MPTLSNQQYSKLTKDLRKHNDQEKRMDKEKAGEAEEAASSSGFNYLAGVF